MAIEVSLLTESIDLLADECHRIAVDHGWWEGTRNFAETLALIMSESIEALEEWRKYSLECGYYEVPDGYGGMKPKGWAVEHVDTIIRCLDNLRAFGPILWLHPDDLDASLSGGTSLNGSELRRMSIADVFNAVMTYNETRKYRHGGKLG